MDSDILTSTKSPPKDRESSCSQLSVFSTGLHSQNDLGEIGNDNLNSRDLRMSDPLLCLFQTRWQSAPNVTAVSLGDATCVFWTPKAGIPSPHASSPQAEGAHAILNTHEKEPWYLDPTSWGTGGTRGQCSRSFIFSEQRGILRAMSELQQTQRQLQPIAERK